MQRWTDCGELNPNGYIYATVPVSTLMDYHKTQSEKIAWARIAGGLLSYSLS